MKLKMARIDPEVLEDREDGEVKDMDRCEVRRGHQAFSSICGEVGSNHNGEQWAVRAMG